MPLGSASLLPGAAPALVDPHPHPIPTKPSLTQKALLAEAGGGWPASSCGRPSLTQHVPLPLWVLLLQGCFLKTASPSLFPL